MFRSLGEHFKNFIENGGPANEKNIRDLSSVTILSFTCIGIFVSLVFTIVLFIGDTRDTGRPFTEAYFSVLLVFPLLILGWIIVLGFIEIETNASNYLYHTVLITLFIVFAGFGMTPGMIVSVVVLFLLFVRYFVIEFSMGSNPEQK
jgi:hypothetical protein